MQTLKINVAKIDKTALYNGAKGSYLTLNLKENKDGTDQYGNDGFIIQDIGKDRRLAGEKGPILGNGEIVGQKQSAPVVMQTQPIDQDENVPF